MDTTEPLFEPDDDTRTPTAFRITINGEPYCEAEDLTTVTMVVDEVHRRAERRITLYASGSEGPLQWMTAGLRVGDQVVIEIVDAAAERQSAPEHCDFCGRPAHTVHKLIQNSEGSICDVCIAGFSAAVQTGNPLPAGASFCDASTLPCRFCGNVPPAISGVVMRNGAAICAECLRAGTDILQDRPK